MSPAGLRVALMHPCYWPEVHRGGERTVHDLAVDLLAAGHRPRLLTSHPGPTARGVENGIPVLRVRRPPDGWLRRAGLVDHLTHVPLAYLALSRGEADVVHALHATDALAAGRWARRRGRPSVFSHLGIPDHAGLTDALGRLQLIRAAVGGCDVVTVHSHAAARAFARWLGVRARVVYPGVDLGSFSPGGDRAAEATVFCAAAAEDPRKRVGVLLEAAGRVRRRLGRQLRLRLIRPPDPVFAERLARSDGVELIDSVADASALAREYRQAWVSALPSVGEAGGLVVLESLACGTPVVGSDDAVVPELIDAAPLGRVARPDDAAALAQALEQALELAGDPATAAACRTRAEQFSTQRAAAAYEAIYQELLAQR